MFDFPNSPTTGQTVTNGTSTYRWDGVKWVAIASGGWADAPSDGNTYGRRNAAWNSVDAMLAPRDNNTGRNLVHNGQFRIQQRGTGAWTASSSYTADRWLLAFNLDNDSAIVFALTDGDRAAIGDETAVSGWENTFTGNAAAAAYSVLIQPIEDVRRLSGKTVTLSFWANATGALKLGASLDQNFGNGGSPSPTVNGNGQSVTLSTSWQRYVLTFTLPSTAGKTLGTNNNSQTTLYFWFSGGSSYAARSGSVGVQSGTINIWGVQLEIGSVATPLAKRDPADDLALCQRFYQVGTFWLAGSGQAASSFGYAVSLPVAMRATPSVTPTFSYTNASGGAVGADSRSVTLYATTGSNGGCIINGTFTASADL